MPDSPPTNAARRRFLLWLGNGALFAALWQAGRGVLRFLTPPLTHPLPAPVRVGAPAEYAPHTLTYIPAATAWLGRDEKGFFALSAVCPHLGCTLRRAAPRFECPCHGSRFDEGGAVLNGPATSPMRFLAVISKEGELMIDVTRTVSPETRLGV